jgi:hypothetical protein
MLQFNNIFAEKMACFYSIYYKLLQTNAIVTLVFKRTPIFRRKSAKIAEIVLITLTPDFLVSRYFPTEPSLFGQRNNATKIGPGLPDFH